VVVDPFATAAVFYDRVFVNFTVGIVRNIFMAALLIVLFYFMLTRPLLHLIIGIGKIDLNEPGNARLYLPDNNLKDELQVLADWINQLLGSIRHCMEELRGVEEDLKQKNRIVEVTLQNMDEGIVMLDRHQFVFAYNLRFLELCSFQMVSFHNGHRGSNFPATMLKIANMAW